MENSNSFIIEKNTILKLKSKKVIISERAVCHAGNNKGYFILDLQTPVFFKDLSTLPVRYVECNDIYEEYDLKNNNIVIGKVEDICFF